MISLQEERAPPYVTHEPTVSNAAEMFSADVRYYKLMKTHARTSLGGKTTHEIAKLFHTHMMSPQSDVTLWKQEKFVEALEKYTNEASVIPVARDYCTEILQSMQQQQGKSPTNDRAACINYLTQLTAKPDQLFREALKLTKRYLH